MSLLDTINSPDDLKKLPIGQLPALCGEIRQFLIETLSLSGGHLSSNLGTIELTVALHYVYDSPRDTLIWDVGHQSYTHKILTGRKKLLHSIRQTGGISGFPRESESPHDFFNAGHAGTSISLGLGQAIAQSLSNRQKNKGKVVSIIGDASIATGIAFEAMNHSGHLKKPFLVILNDNEMSISGSIGGLSYTLTSLINTRLYQKWRNKWMGCVRWVPVFGRIMERMMLRFASNMKSVITEHQFFEELGFRYLGPLDGHDVVKMVHMLQKLRGIDKPTLLHLVTKKGKGYPPAEKDPTMYHGVGKFDKESGEMPRDPDSWPLSEFAGQTLNFLGKPNKQICVITPAMTEGSGLTSFATSFPDRFFDTGIAEQHAGTLAASLARSGLSPFLCIYSTFLQRAYDQVVHDIALMNMPVTLVIDRAGVVGGDGETHQGLYDIGYLHTVPNIRILSPSGPHQLMTMLSFAATWRESPVAIRFPKSSAKKELFDQGKKLLPVKNTYNPFLSTVVKKGNSIAILTEGTMLENGLEAAEIIEKKKGKNSVMVVSLNSIKPIDKTGLTKALKGKKAVFTIENHNVTGGAGQIIKAELFDQLQGKLFHSFGYPDKFIEHGDIKSIEHNYLLDGKSLAEAILKMVK